MSKYEQNKLLKKKVSKLIYDIEAISKELAQQPDHIYEVLWKPRILRLLDFVTEQFVAESKMINEEAA